MEYTTPILTIERPVGYHAFVALLDCETYECDELHEFEWQMDDYTGWADEFRRHLQTCKEKCTASDECHLMQFQKPVDNPVAKCVAVDASVNKEEVQEQSFDANSYLGYPDNYPDGVTWDEVAIHYKTDDCCSDCAQGKYSQYVDMQPCAACPAGQIHSEGDSGWDYVNPNCKSCEAGKYATADMTTCEVCAPGKISGEGAGECTLCPRGKYMSKYEVDYAAFDLHDTDNTNPFHHDNLTAYWESYCDADCHGCREQQYRYNCTAETPGECQQCESCSEGFARVGCVHYNGTTTYPGEVAGRCVDSSVLVRAPQCPQEVSGVAEPVSPDLSGFTFEQVFGQPQTTLIDFQCRQTCIGRTEDTTYCTGPHACNRPACTMVRTEDGAPDYLVARGCPVLLPDVDMDGRAVVDLSEVEEMLLSEARAAQCQTCATCGSDPPVGATDWGLGCAVECSQLECDAGEIFDFTAPAGTKCRACSELTDFRLCSTADQEKLDVNTDSVSGLGQLLRWSGCRPKPGSVDVAGDAGGPASYGPCEACEPPECGQNEYPHTCSECVSCRLRNVDQMYQGRYVNATFDPHPVFCQLPPCADARTAVENTGEVCVRRGIGTVENIGSHSGISWSPTRGGGARVGSS